ncbi:hypothetical protein MKX03_020399, partial [Papaver bracteatum]
GNGLHSSLLHRMPSMCTSTLFTTTMSKFGCQASSKLASILDTLRCFISVYEFYA